VAFLCLLWRALASIDDFVTRGNQVKEISGPNRRGFRPFRCPDGPVFAAWLLLLGLFSIGGRVLAAPPLLQPAPGYQAKALDLSGSTVAVSPGGRVALAHDAADGTATITLYDRLDPAGRQTLETLKAPQGDTFRFFGGLAFRDDETLFFSENGDMETVYTASVGTGEVQALAPKKSLPNVADVAIRRSDGLLFALVTPGPGQGAVYTLSGGQTSLFAKGLGIGYVTGLAFSPTERLFVGDTADPAFTGKPGQILELGSGGQVVRTIPLAAGGGSGLGGLTVDAEGDLLASTGQTITEVRLSAASPGVLGPRVREFGRFSDPNAFPSDLLFRGSRFEPASGDGTVLVNVSLQVNGVYTSVLLALSTTAEQPFLPTDFATRVVAFDGKNGKNGFNLRPEAAIGPPSSAATPQVPDNKDIVSFGWGGSITLAFDRPILRDPLHPGGYDFVVFGNSFYVGGNEHISFQAPGYVEVGVDTNGNGVPDADEPFYLLRGRPDPGSPPAWPLPASLYGAIDHRQTPMLGYAGVTPTDGHGDPLLPDDPTADGITPGSAGGDAFSLSWAVDSQGHAVVLDHADFVRITHALDAVHPVFGRSATQVDAVSLVRPTAR
jgi:hypothetical protein